MKVAVGSNVLLLRNTISNYIITFKPVNTMTAWTILLGMERRSLPWRFTSLPRFVQLSSLALLWHHFHPHPPQAEFNKQTVGRTESD